MDEQSKHYKQKLGIKRRKVLENEQDTIEEGNASDVVPVEKKTTNNDSNGDDDNDNVTNALENSGILPDELKHIDFSKRISWRKNCTTLVPENEKVVFTKESPALCFHVHAVDGFARATTVHLPQGRKIPTPRFMPVGTKGTIKSITAVELEEELQCPIILGNTYHLALQPGTELIRDQGGLHHFMGLRNNTALLTDSGGFQMVSLLKLAEITEEGVTFASPYSQNNDNERMLLRPEDSIQHQNNIGADIIMALDDVVSSVTDDASRYRLATYRTLRWLDRCFNAHSKPQTQNLFAIVQGGLDVTLGGLREQCLAGFLNRDNKIPGYAIGGLAGGESKDDFWKVVHQCCRALPDDKPRYLMGVGYPLDLVICTALGVDMYDCVYPTRTARFGVALVQAGQTLRLRNHECQNDDRPIDDKCRCQACQYYSRGQLHTLLKANNPLAATLMTHHNITYMMTLVTDMRNAIQQHCYKDFCHNFIQQHFSYTNDKIPQWVLDALNAAGIPY